MAEHGVQHGEERGTVSHFPSQPSQSQRAFLVCRCIWPAGPAGITELPWGAGQHDDDCEYSNSMRPCTPRTRIGHAT